MAYDIKYYEDRRNKLREKDQRNLQELVNAAIRFTQERDDIIGRWSELAEREKESQEKESKKEPEEKKLKEVGASKEKK